MTTSLSQTTHLSLALLGTLFVCVALVGACSDDEPTGDALECPPGERLVGRLCRPVEGSTTTTGQTNTSGTSTTNTTGTTSNTSSTTSTSSTTGTTSNTTQTGTSGGEGCVIGQSRCADATTVERCTDASGTWEPQPCGEDQLCDNGSCRVPFCEPGTLLPECLSPTDQAQCNDTGTGRTPVPCPNGQNCRNGGCTDQLCTPGSTVCQGSSAVMICSDDGQRLDPYETCPASSLCDEGACRSLCELNSKTSSYLGCDYWSVDLDNIESAEVEPHAIVVSNPDPELTAEITITRADGTVEPLANPNVGPSSIGVFEMPTQYGVNGSGIFNNNAWKITASIPVTVHQFNPLNGNSANGDPIFTNDASLLLPVNALNTRYIGMSWKHRSRTTDLRGFLTVVASEPGETEVTIIPSTRVVTGPGLPSGGLPAGQIWTTTLTQGDVLNLETFGPVGQDLTGSTITGSQNIVVFGGHECANIPNENIEACDHIEQQLFPVASWGTRYMAIPFKPRSPRQEDTWTIVAGDENATLFTNPITNIHGLTLAPGQKIEYQTGDSFELTSNAPIQVGHFLHSSNYDGFTRNDACSGFTSNGIGDPAFTMAVPVEQYRDNYTVLTPEDYTENYLNIIAPTGTVVTLDGQPVTGLTPLGGTAYSTAQVSVSEGTHRLTADQPFGLVAYGYDCFVSYAYPGGLNLENLD